MAVDGDLRPIIEIGRWRILNNDDTFSVPLGMIIYIFVFWKADCKESSS
jgi:hypothetical protein